MRWLAMILVLAACSKDRGDSPAPAPAPAGDDDQAAAAMAAFYEDTRGDLREAPLAVARAELAELEAKLDGEAFDSTMRDLECTGLLDWDLAIEVLETHHASDPIVGELKARFEAVCPGGDASR